jgi:hypothetical protein
MEVKSWLQALDALLLRKKKQKDFSAECFDASIRRCDKCIIVGVGYVEENMFFFPGLNITCFTFYIHLWPIY